MTLQSVVLSLVWTPENVENPSLRPLVHCCPFPFHQLTPRSGYMRVLCLLQRCRWPAVDAQPLLCIQSLCCKGRQETDSAPYEPASLQWESTSFISHFIFSRLSCCISAISGAEYTGDSTLPPWLVTIQIPLASKWPAVPEIPNSPFHTVVSDMVSFVQQHFVVLNV